jgi:hypothetical protein
MRGGDFKMDYCKIETAHRGNIQWYLDKGWDIFRTTEEVYPGEGSNIVYHVGYPLKKRVEELSQIIKCFEDNGFKEQLFKKVAEENQDDFENYIADGGTSTAPTAEFMSWYETIVQNREKRFSKKRSPVDFDF